MGSSGSRRLRPSALAPALSRARGIRGALTFPLNTSSRADGLRSTVRAENIGADAAPYGVCPHPYLVAGPAPLDEWTVQIPATEFMEVSDDRLLPDGHGRREGHAFDFRAEKVLGAVEIDHAFTGLIPNADGLAAVRAYDPSGTGVELEWDAAWPWLQIHTADKPAGPSRLGLAVEPMTCPPDAFNSGTGVIRLAPGESHEASWTIRALSRLSGRSAVEVGPRVPAVLCEDVRGPAVGRRHFHAGPIPTPATVP